MLRSEAQEEAERLNTTDERAQRLEFYPMDASAGLSDDAWEVATRLREGDPPPRRPARVGAPAATVAAESAPGPANAPEPLPAGESGLVDYEPELVDYEAEPVYYAAEPSAAAEPGYEPQFVDQEVWTGERGRSRRARPAREPKAPRAPRERRERDPHRPGIFTRLIGIVVLLMGLLWIGMTVAVIMVLGVKSAAALGVYAIAFVLGLLALFLGRAILRS